MLSAPAVDNANAGVFFSTATLLIGVVVTVVGAALAQILLDAASSDGTERDARRRNLIVLAVVILVDIWGVGFPLYALYRAALGEVSDGLITQVFVSTILVGVASAILPVYLVGMLFNINYWFNLARLGLMRSDARAEAFRKMLIEGGYIEGDRYDSLMLSARTGAINYESAVELLTAFNKFLVLRKRKGISSLFRTFSYYYFQVTLIPFYAQRLARRGAGPENDLGPGDHDVPAEPSDSDSESKAADGDS
jgi:hypothetical protein